MKVVQYTPAEWRKVSENAHKIAFSTHKPADLDRIDYALLVVSDQDVPAGYITCREFDRDTVYWQFGGTFPGTRETIQSFAAYKAAISWTKERYQRITTLIENTNTVMLKMAMKVGFRIVGIRNFKGSVLLEHALEF